MRKQESMKKNLLRKVEGSGKEEVQSKDRLNQQKKLCYYFAQLE